MSSKLPGRSSIAQATRVWNNQVSTDFDSSHLQSPRPPVVPSEKVFGVGLEG